MAAGDKPKEMSFWDHLDELRGVIWRSLLAVSLCSVVAFIFKKVLFDDIVLAPVSPDFITYRILGIKFSMEIINIEISTQFFVHLRAACAAGFVVSCPYIIYQIWSFIAPALYRNERKAVRGAVTLASVLFYVGVLVGFYIVLPMCLNFFADYKVSETVENSIALSSYISLFMSMVLMIGLVFEFPTVVVVLSSLGLMTRRTLRKYRRHAIVAILVVAAIITPADPLSMIVLAIPLYAMYEFSILICKSPKSEELQESNA